MIRALRITSIVVAATAVILLVLPAVAPARRGIDPQIEEFLKAPGSVQKFTAAKAQGSAGSETQASPLVKEALVFAQFLNPPLPPAPPEAPPTVADAAPEVAPTAPVSVKFDLIGTSFYATRPELSLALIDEPGKGLYWIRQGDSVGHLIIEQVKDGSITIKDGSRTSEKTVVVHELWKDLLKPPAASTSEAQPATSSTAVTAKPSGARGAPAPRTAATAPAVGGNPPATTGGAPTPSLRNQPRRSTQGAKNAAQPPQQPGSSPAAASPDKSTVRQPVKSPPVQPVTPPVQPAPEVKQQEQGVQPNNEAPIAPPKLPSEKEIIHMRLQEEVKASKITPEEAKRMEEMAQTLEQLEQLREAAAKSDSNAP